VRRSAYPTRAALSAEAGTPLLSIRSRTPGPMPVPSTCMLVLPTRDVKEPRQCARRDRG